MTEHRDPDLSTHPFHQGATCWLPHFKPNEQPNTRNKTVKLNLGCMSGKKRFSNIYIKYNLITQHFMRVSRYYLRYVCATHALG